MSTLRGILKLEEPLAPYTTWHIGGVADRYYRPADVEALSSFLASLAPDEPITFLGLGSNVLISDAGIRGTVIHLLGGSSTVAVMEAETQTAARIRVRAEAGLTCAKLAKFCAKEGLQGAEFFAGIPGTVGGALAMNAGAWGGETWKNVVQVEVMNRRGQRVLRSPSEYKIAYRSVQGPAEEWFIAGYFQFAVGDPTRATAKIKTLLQQRSASQPITVFSCGSVFKNPEGNHAGRLIEAANLKGFRVGDAQVSPKHANFILNLGNARAQDVLDLIQHIQTIVFRESQIYLQPEVRILGYASE